MHPRSRRPFGLLAAVVVGGLAVWAVAQPPAADRTDNLRQRVAALTEQNRKLEERLAAGRKRLDELRRKLADPAPTERPAAGDGKPPPAETKEETVEFRPPVVRETNTRPRFTAVCEKQRLALFDQVAFREAIKDRADDFTDGKLFVLSAGDYDARLSLPLGKPPSVELVLKPGRQGQTAAQFTRPGSEYRRRLADLDPTESHVDFEVFPDSFETFRDARAILWEKKGLKSNWFPNKAGEPIRLGPGGGKSVVQ